MYTHLLLWQCIGFAITLSLLSIWQIQYTVLWALDAMHILTSSKRVLVYIQDLIIKKTGWKC